MKGITNNYLLQKYRELTAYYLDMGFSYELAQKLAYREVWGND